MHTNAALARCLSYSRRTALFQQGEFAAWRLSKDAFISPRRGWEDLPPSVIILIGTWSCVYVYLSYNEWKTSMMLKDWIHLFWKSSSKTLEITSKCQGSWDHSQTLPVCKVHACCRSFVWIMDVFCSVSVSLWPSLVTCCPSLVRSEFLT